MATITCVDCGTQRCNTPSNTKYCKPCRLLRDIAYWEHNTRNCGNCHIPFSPMGGRDYFCSEHAVADWHQHAIRLCALCNQEKPPIIAGVDLCHGCARNPKKRSLLVRALKNGKAQRAA
jgi:hypothetical protein